MAIITFCGESFTVDHAVKGADYVHGYDVNGNLIISLDGVKDFSVISYDGTYMSPTECLAELCNDVKHCNGAFKKRDGTVLAASDFGAAPSGYGLGTGNAKSISSLDEITGAGWYNKWFEASELPTGAAHGNLNFYVGFYGSPNYFEIIMPVNHNYTDYSNLSLLKRRRDDSGWKPWEWEHPPMELGVVYRTTERVNGRPVFKKRFQTGYITAGAHTFAHGITSDIVGYALAGVAYVQMNDAAGANVTLYKEISNLTADINVVAFEGCAFGNATITVAVY